MGDNGETFVFYESFFLGMERMSDEKRLMWYDIIAKYGLYREEPKNLSDSDYMTFVHIKLSIRNAKKNYEEAVANGKKGGRQKLFTPEQEQEIYEKTKTMKITEVAKLYGCSVRTVESITKVIRENENNVKNDINTVENEQSINMQKCKNPYVYDYVYEDVYEDKSISTSMQQNKFVANEIPTPQQVHDFYIKNEDLKMLPYEFYNYCERNNWYANNEPVYDWRKCYKTLNDINNDYQYDNVYHDTQLIFNSSDYVIL